MTYLFGIQNFFCNLFSQFQVVKGWVKHLTRLRGYTDQMVEDANAVIVTFGSYRLGVSLLAPILDDAHPHTLID